MNIELPGDLRSVRFFPFWNYKVHDQVVGLIQLILDVCKLGNNLVGMEIGTYIGESATLFLSFPNIKTLHCVDAYKCDLALERLKNPIKNKRCILHHKLSESLFKEFNEELDFIYIDGDHSYEGAKRDIVMGFEKVKKGGLVSGHDYNNIHPGVIKAVDEFVKENNYQIKTYCDSSWSFIK